MLRHPAWLLAPLVLLFVVAYLYPLIRMMAVSITGGELSESLDRLIGVPLYQQALLRTVRVSFIVAIATVAIAYPVAAFIAARSERLRGLLLAVVFMTVFMSVVVRTYVWITILRPRGILDAIAVAVGLPPLDGALFNNEWAVVIGMVNVLLPLAILPLYAAFRRLDPTLSQAAASLGANRARQWARVVVPLTMSSAVASAVLVFLLSLGFFVTPAILGGPQALMIGTLINNQIAANNIPFAGLISIGLLAATVIVLLLLRFVLGRFRNVGLM